MIKLCFPVVAVVSIFPAFGAPITTPECPSATAAVYQTLSSGCSEGVFTIKGFSWSNTGNKVAAPGDVVITPSSTLGVFGLDFLSNSAFTVSGNDHIRVLFHYTIDPPPIIRGYSIGISPTTSTAASPLAALASPAALDLPAVATIDADLCAGGLFNPGGGCPDGNGQSLSVQLNSAGQGQLFDSVVFTNPVNIVDVSIILDMRGNGATAPFRIAGGLTGATVVPEPGAFGLALLGLTALSLGRRRFRRL
jgi:hypothetical protein